MELADLVTVVVVPRERFGFAAESLASIEAETPWLRHLVYVDAGSPPRIRREIERRAAIRGFTYVRTEGYCSPNEARNLGSRHVRTPYVVFIDNDVVVRPGWLDRLLACALETGAAIVGPLYLIDVGGRVSIHMAGGDAHIVGAPAARACVERHRGHGDPLAAAPMRREECELVEFHTMLVRTALLEELGGLDEGLRSLNEHLDLCLSARALGHRVFFEPTSVITYVPAMRLHVSDVRYFMLRWSERWNRSTFAHFVAKWSLAPQLRDNRRVLDFARIHRCRGLRVVPGSAPKARWSRVPFRIVYHAETWINLALVGRGERDARERPRPDERPALQSAGG